MPAPLKIPNYLDRNLLEPTILTADLAVSATSVPVENLNNFSANDYILIGRPGEEQSEVRQVSGSPITNITVAALSYAHSHGEQVNKLFGTKLRVYYAPDVDGTAPDVSAFSNLLGEYTMDTDQPDTYIEDANGSSARWYIFTYYNPTSTAETEKSLSAAVRGAEYGNYCTVAEILKESGMSTNRNISHSIVNEKRQAAERLIDGKLTGIYTVPFTDPIPATIVNLALRLSSGLLLMRYGMTYAEGKKKYDDAYTELDNIQQRQQAVVSQNGASMATNTEVGGFSMYPDDTTDGADFEDGGPGFTTEMRY